MKKYRVTVRNNDNHFSFTVDAENEKNAIQKAYDEHGDLVTTATFVELK